MRKVTLLTIALIFAAALLHAQDDDYDESISGVALGAGLTRKPIGNFSVVTAEDAQVSTDGKQAWVEDIYEYVGRKFKAVEARLRNIEAAQEEINNKIKDIEKDLSKAKKSAPSLKEIFPELPAAGTSSAGPAPAQATE